MNDDVSSDLRRLCQLLNGQKPVQTMAAHEWQGIRHQAEKHAVQALLAWRIQQQQFTLEDDFRQQLTLSIQQSAARYALFYHAQQQITTVLNKAQIPCIWLKGMALAPTVYPAPFQRFMLDMDILVPYEARLQALATLASIGYHQADDESALFSPNELAHKAQRHHFFLRGGVGASIILEVHFYLLGGNEALLSTPHLAWFWQQTMTIATERFSFVGLAPEAHLLYLCAHAVLHHGLYEFVLRRYLDLHLLIQQAPINWDMVVMQALELRWSYAVERALQQTQALFDTPIPPTVFAVLREKRHPDENPYRVDAISDAGSQVAMAWMMLQPMTWRERLHYVHLMLLPPQNYMRQHYHVPQNHPLWSYYIKRWKAQLSQVVWICGNRLLSKLGTNQSD